MRESSSRSYDGNVSPDEVAVFVLNFLIRIRPVQTDVLPSLQLRLLPNKPYHFHSSCFLVFFFALALGCEQKLYAGEWK